MTPSFRSPHSAPKPCMYAADFLSPAERASAMIIPEIRDLSHRPRRKCAVGRRRGGGVKNQGGNEGGAVCRLPHITLLPNSTGSVDDNVVWRSANVANVAKSCGNRGRVPNECDTEAPLCSLLSPPPPCLFFGDFSGAPSPHLFVRRRRRF